MAMTVVSTISSYRRTACWSTACVWCACGVGWRAAVETRYAPVVLAESLSLHETLMAVAHWTVCCETVLAIVVYTLFTNLNAIETQICEYTCQANSRLSKIGKSGSTPGPICVFSWYFQSPDEVKYSYFYPKMMQLWRLKDVYFENLGRTSL